MSGALSARGDKGVNIFQGRCPHLQRILIEAAKLAPVHHHHLHAVHRAAVERGYNRNRATLAVARKLVAYLLAVDKSGVPFMAPH